MARKQKVLPEVEEVSSDGIPLRARGKQQEGALSEAPKSEASEKRWRSMSKEPRRSSAGERSPSSAQSRSQIARTNRIYHYEAVRTLHRASHLRARDCSSLEHVAQYGAYISCLRVFSRAKQTPLSSKHPRSLQALHS